MTPFPGIKQTTQDGAVIGVDVNATATAGGGIKFSESKKPRHKIELNEPNTRESGNELSASLGASVRGGVGGSTVATETITSNTLKLAFLNLVNKLADDADKGIGGPGMRAGIMLGAANWLIEQIKEHGEKGTLKQFLSSVPNYLREDKDFLYNKGFERLGDFIDKEKAK